ncbi:amidohydrolase family protein [Methylobacterium sp. J-026]|uniref:amidohydrolase family protein n=1 Tax=Methylobacterium sp. J-026 TaxID=2836624 RepID=UPI001FBB5768|nr:amidohydrolase family protein [Methylobacterium sp. J-026]MCJ2133285.1 amidohydrolase family protein [Methylobacterium sp. J-026]
MSRDCLPPQAPEPPGFALPDDACDSHTHVFGPYARSPLAEDRSYTPPENDGAALVRQLDAMGLARCVIVTASAYGDDNRAMLDALAVAPDRLRGVAVLSEGVGEADLDAMTEAGVRGVRVNLFRRNGRQVYRNGMGLDALRTLAPRLRARGWHLQAWLHAPDLPELWPSLTACGMPVVIDHMGRMSTARGVADPGFALLCRLVADGTAWTKISGADRLTEAGPLYGDVDPFAAALIAANPERLVWGSDWPHINYFGGASDHGVPSDADLLRTLRRWTDDSALHRILVDNPAALYGFP